MKKRFVLPLLFVLSACSHAVKDAEEKYEIVKSNTDNKDDICEAAREVQRAALQDKDEAKFKDWKLTADINCMSASLDHQLRIH